MASRNPVGKRIESHLLDHGLSPEQFGEKVGLSGVTIRRVIDPETYGANAGRHHFSTKFVLARELREDPSTLWPPRTAQRKPKVAA